jgi:hypothetical protein
VLGVVSCAHADVAASTVTPKADSVIRLIFRPLEIQRFVICKHYAIDCVNFANTLGIDSEILCVARGTSRLCAKPGGIRRAARIPASTARARFSGSFESRHEIGLLYAGGFLRAPHVSRSKSDGPLLRMMTTSVGWAEQGTNTITVTSCRASDCMSNQASM